MNVYNENEMYSALLNGYMKEIQKMASYNQQMNPQSIARAQSQYNAAYTNCKYVESYFNKVARLSLTHPAVAEAAEKLEMLVALCDDHNSSI